MDQTLLWRIIGLRGMDLCVNFGGLERRLRHFIFGFGSSEYQALPRSFHEGRPGSVTLIYHRDGPPRRQHRQHSLLWACKEKFTPWSYRNARMPARFFRFPRGPSHSSYSEQRRKKNRQCRCLCCEPDDRSALGALLLLEKVFF